MISLEEFVKYFLKQWKIVGILVAICVILFVGSTKLFGEEITVPHSEEYLHYEQELEWHESYFEKSVLMNIDPMSIPQRTILLRNVGDKEVMRVFVTSSEIWGDFPTDWEKDYFAELVTWSEIESGTVELTLRHASSEECMEAAEYLKEKILSKDSSAEVMIGEETIVKDEDLQEEHSRWYSRIDYVNSLLLEAEAGYTIHISMSAAAVMGVLIGGFISIIILFVMCLNKKRK